MFNPKISIIIPVFNGSDYLDEAIKSALNQTYENKEIIVINDGSNDQGLTEKVAQSYHDQIIYINKENGGVASALNLGIEKMSGEYFSWLSHDDLYYPNKLEKQVKYLATLKDKITVTSSDYLIVDQNQKPLSEMHLTYKPDELLYKLLMNSFINGCTLLIPKEVFETIGNFENTLKTTQDYHLWFRIMEKYQFHNIPELLVKSRQHPGQDSRTKLYIFIKERKKLEDFIFHTFSKEDIKKSAHTILPTQLFIILTKIKLARYRLLGYMALIAEKLGIYTLMARIYRKLFY